MENPPRVYTPEEVREKFLRYVWALVDYWTQEDRSSRGHALEGLAHSILVMLDGESAELPSFHLIPVGQPDDQRFYRERGENWYPICQIDHEYDIAGGLHDNFFQVRPREVGGQ